MQQSIPKQIVREHVTLKGAKIRGIGPVVYGYSMIIGSYDKHSRKEFDNLRSSA